MSSSSIRAVGLVIVLGLVVGALGVVAADLYTVGVLILFVGGVGAAVLSRRVPHPVPQQSPTAGLTAGR